MSELIPVDFNPFTDELHPPSIATTDEQREIWTSIKVGGTPANLSYNESVSLLLKGNFQYKAFCFAVSKTIERHEALRGLISADGNTISFQSSLDVAIPQIDLSVSSAKQTELEKIIHDEMNLPFDLEKGPLARFKVIRLDENSHQVILSFHHIICDGWSIGIIMQDISKFYSATLRGALPDLEPVVKFSKYADDEKEFKSSATYSLTENFWVNQYAQSVPQMDVPADKLRPAVRTFAANRIDYVLDEKIIAQLRTLSAKAGTSFFTALLAAFEVYMHRLTQQSDFVVGLPVAGQNTEGSYNLVGHCVHFLPLRTAIDSTESFNTHLRKRKKYFLDALDNQRYTFGSLVPKLNMVHDPSRIPLAPVAFNLDTGMTDGVEFTGLQMEFKTNARHYDSFELNYNLSGSGNKITIECTFNSDLFDDDVMQSRLKQFAQIIKSVTQNPDTSIGKLQLLADDELHKIINEWNATSLAFSIDECIHESFQRQAHLHPNKTAIEFKGEKISYSELNIRANKLAHHLRTLGIDTEIPVGIFVERNIEMVVCMLAVFKAGGAYIPMDPVYPADRIEYMLANTNAPVVISQKKLSDTLKSYQGKIVLIDEHAKTIDAEDETNPVQFTTAQNLAYILYTSGSTGKPKGVMIEHHSLVSLMEWGRNLFGKENLDGAVANASFNFDISVFEILLPITSGGKLILIENALAISSLKKEADARLMFMVPSAMKELLKNTAAFPSTLKTVYLGGEYVSQELVDTIFDTTGIKTVFDFYGPTECTIISTFTKRFKNGAAFIGKPIGNYQCYILDNNGEPVGISSPGELCIGGEGVARGYWNNTNLTTEKFEANKFNHSQKIYKSGDIVRWRKDGNIEFIGRKDNQVKIRGYRIELGEIESQLQKHAAIKDVCVIVREDVVGDKRIAAYIVFKQNQSVEINEIKSYLKSELPEYMVPAAFVVMEKLPLTLNGKIDTKQLPVPDLSKPIESANFEEPHTPIESMLAGIWCDVLGINKIGIHDNFFELGGHSLLGIRMMAEIESRMGATLDYPTLFRASTISQLAKVINKEELNIEWPITVQLQKGNNETPLFFVHMHNGNIQRWRVLLKYLPSTLPVYALQPQGLDENKDYHYNLPEMAAFYINEIKKIQPKGPYKLAGLCFGGTTAYEMSKQLKALGDEVELTFMINNYAPPENPMQYKIRETWDEFNGMDFGDKLEFALEKTKSVGRKMMSMVNKVVGNSQATVVASEKKSKPDVRWVHSVALLSYQPKDIYNGNAVLVRTGEEVAKHYDNYLGWQRLINGKINLHVVAGSTNDSIITEEQYFSQLGKILSDEISKAGK